MFTPEGQPADKMDKIMLLAMWTQATVHERAHAEFLGIGAHPPIISAGMGRPTFPINTHTIDSSISYWKKIKARLSKYYLPLEALEHFVLFLKHLMRFIKTRQITE